MPKLSVLLPVYNGIGNYPYGLMAKSIQSILSLYADLELIIIDDGSDDGTFENLAAINQHLHSVGDKRLKLFSNTHNQGQGSCLNFGLGKATGKYIWQWSVRAMAHPSAVGLIEALDNNPAIGFVYGHMYSYGGEKDYTHNPPRHFDVKRFARRYRCNWYMFRRIDDIEYVEQMTTPEGRFIGVTDRDMLMQLMDKGLTGLALHDTLCVIYYNGGRHAYQEVPYRAEIHRVFNERWEHML